MLDRAEHHVAQQPLGHVVRKLAAVDRLAEQVAHLLGVTAVQFKDGGVLIVLFRPHLGHHITADRRPRLDRLQRVPDQVSQLVVNAAECAAVDQIRIAFDEPLLRDAQQQLILVLEITIDRALDDVRAFGDFGHRDALMAFFIDHLACSLENVGHAPIEREPNDVALAALADGNGVHNGRYYLAPPSLARSLDLITTRRAMIVFAGIDLPS